MIWLKKRNIFSFFLPFLVVRQPVSVESQIPSLIITEREK
jgi:hypothetical protein